MDFILLIIFLCLFSISVVISVFDFKLKLIPDTMNLSLLLLGTIYAIVERVPIWTILFLGFFVFLFNFVGYLMTKKKEDFGMGDAKYLFCIIPFLKLDTLTFFGIASGIFCFFLFFYLKISKKESVPMGPFFSFSLLFAFLATNLQGQENAVYIIASVMLAFVFIVGLTLISIKEITRYLKKEGGKNET